MRKNHALQLSFVCAVYLKFVMVGATVCILGCGDDDETNDSEPVDSEHETTEQDTCGGFLSQIVLDEAHDYTFSSEVDIKDFDIQGYPNIPTFRWGGVTKDILGHEIDPVEDVGHVDVIVWKLDNYETFEDWLNTDSLDSTKLVSPVSLLQEELDKGIAEGSLDKFCSFGYCPHTEEFFNVKGIYPPDEHIFVLVIGRGNGIGEDAIAAAFINPVDDPEAATDLDIDDSAITLTYEMSFSEKSFRVISDPAGITLDWVDMIGENNALGQVFYPSDAGRIMLTFYRDKGLADLEESFVDLADIADEKYTFEPPDPTPITLDMLEDEAGNAFASFNEEAGTWLLSFWCISGCNNPAPKYLAVVEPCI